jgi:6-pyruvoyltetrahydropterin/6-carboxytetrahydropterin synthase
MYELTVDAEFCAAHALTISGVREEVHGHNWRVTVTIAGETLDPDGLLCDFHTVEDVLAAVIEPFDNRDLNAVAPFDRLNPSAEHVARHIAREMAHRLDHTLAPFARIAAVRVTEARGCAATYRIPADKPADKPAE